MKQQKKQRDLNTKRKKRQDMKKRSVLGTKRMRPKENVKNKKKPNAGYKKTKKLKN